MLLVVVGAASFAAGRALPTAPLPVHAEPAAPAGAAAGGELPLSGEELEPMEQEQEQQELPAGHPPIGAMQQPMQPMQQPAHAGATGDLPAAEPSSLEWTAPARWQVAPNASSMRLATYRVPRAAGDPADAELSITQAGGSADANVDRWIGQFDADARKTAKRGTRKVGSFEVLVVEIQGTYSGGMGKEGAAQPGWALLGAIVPTPGMPHFFKLTGPAKSVLAARAEFDAMIASVRLRGT
jgi:hypothetical protein